jgi:hypothetical protein
MIWYDWLVSTAELQSAVRRCYKETHPLQNQKGVSDMKAFVFALALGTAVVAHQAAAHHSFDGSFSRANLVMMSGKVTEFHLTNPHSFFKLSVPDSNGREALWHVETTSASRLEANGWTAESIKPGDELVVAGYLAKDGHPYLKMEWIRRTDGRALALWLPGPLMPLKGA